MQHIIHEVPRRTAHLRLLLTRKATASTHLRLVTLAWLLLDSGIRIEEA